MILALWGCLPNTPSDSGADDTAALDCSASFDQLPGYCLPQGPDPEREPILVHVDTVVDGDTFYATHVGGGATEKVRIIGIDTPELYVDYGDPECWAQEAYELLDARIDGQDVWLSFDYNDDDPYDRTLAYVHLGLDDDDFVNRWLLREGAGPTLLYDDTPSFHDEFRQDESEARTANAGYWGACSG